MKISDIPTPVLECMDDGHMWRRDRNRDGEHPRYWGVYRWDACPSCKSVKRRIQNSDGTIATSPIKYSQSLEYKAALKFSRPQARRELDRRSTAGFLRAVA